MKKKIIRFTKIILPTMLALTVLVGCSKAGQEENKISQSDTSNANSDTTSALRFGDQEYTTEVETVNGTEVSYRAYKNIVYVEHPVDEEYQYMNIYIPEAYFNDGTIGTFTMNTAPIFFPNSIGGYLPSKAGEPSFEGEVGGDASRLGLTGNDTQEGEKSPNAILLALSKGYIVAAPATRGRTLQADDGTYIGKAPAAIVDLKAAVRYLHYNDDVMPGDANKIISNGTSAGGAMSALLGATGDSEDYDVYLNELGAADASDAIYAVSSYCPITNLEHADSAYEWLFSDIHKYAKMNISMVDGEIKREQTDMELTADEIKNSGELKANFMDYLNQLQLKDENGTMLVLDQEGNGTFKDYLETLIVDSAQKALDNGENLSDYTWITINNGKVENIDFNGYINQIGRSKGCPAFDAIDLSQAENSLFGTEDVDAKHFTEFSLSRGDNGETIADESIIYKMNPMNYIGKDGVNTAQYWRIRHGSEDSDTAITIPTILSLELKAAGYNVDYAVPWGQGHGGDYDLDELFAWMAQL